MPDADAALLLNFVRLSNQVDRIGDAVLDELDLTPALANVMWVLDPDADPPSMRALAAELRYDPSNVTLLADKLAERGLAERRPLPRDGRVRTLVLTASGRSVRERLLAHLSARSPFAVLTAAERLQLAELLAKALPADGSDLPVVAVDEPAATCRPR